MRDFSKLDDVLESGFTLRQELVIEADMKMIIKDTSDIERNKLRFLPSGYFKLKKDCVGCPKRWVSKPYKNLHYYLKRACRDINRVEE